VAAVLDLDLETVQPSWMRDGLGIVGEQSEQNLDDETEWDTVAWSRQEQNQEDFIKKCCDSGACCDVQCTDYGPDCASFCFGGICVDGHICCVNAFANCADISSSVCATLGGTTLPGFTCADDPCTSASCCFCDGHCETISLDDCVGRGGHYDAGFTCETRTCVPWGSCCVGGCLTLTEEQCANVSPDGGCEHLWNECGSCDPISGDCPAGRCCWYVLDEFGFCHTYCSITPEMACAEGCGDWAQNCPPNTLGCTFSWTYYPTLFTDCDAAILHGDFPACPDNGC